MQFDVDALSRGVASRSVRTERPGRLRHVQTSATLVRLPVLGAIRRTRCRAAGSPSLETIALTLSVCSPVELSSSPGLRPPESGTHDQSAQPADREPTGDRRLSGFVVTDHEIDGTRTVAACDTAGPKSDRHGGSPGTQGVVGEVTRGIQCCRAIGRSWKRCRRTIDDRRRSDTPNDLGAAARSSRDGRCSP